MTAGSDVSTAADHLAASAEHLHDLVRAARSPTTRGAYESDVAHFVAWCDLHALAPLPASAATLVAYLESLATGTAPLAEGSSPLVKGHWQVATIERRRSSVAKLHRLAGVASATRDVPVLAAMATIRRTLGVAQVRKAPLLPDAMARVAADLAASADPHAARDLAVVLVGFAAALHCSELVALDHAHLEFDAGGVWLTLARRPVDQAGRATRVGVPHGTGATCPVRALRAWLARLGRGAGPVFTGIACTGKLRNRLAGGEVARIVRRFAARAGLDPAQFAGHSLRRGFVTAAERADRDASEIMRQTGHRDAAAVRLCADARDWKRNPARGLL